MKFENRLPCTFFFFKKKIDTELGNIISTICILCQLHPKYQGIKIRQKINLN